MPAGPPTGPAPELPAGDLDLESVDLELRLEPDTGRLRGRARLVLARPQETPVVLALARELQVLSAADGRGGTLEPRRSSDLLRLDPGPGGLEELHLEFLGEPRQGLWLERGEDGLPRAIGCSPMAAPAGAWFPRSTDPGDRVLASLRLALPPGWGAVASGRRTGPGEWRTERPARCADLALAARRGSEVHTRTRDGWTLEVLAEPGAGEALAGEVRAVVRELSAATLAPPPWDTLAVTAPGGLAAAGHDWVGPGGDLASAVALTWLRSQAVGEQQGLPSAEALAAAWGGEGVEEDGRPLWLRRALGADVDLRRAACRPLLGAFADPLERTRGLELLASAGAPGLEAWRVRPRGPRIEIDARATGGGGRLLLTLAQTHEVGPEGRAKEFGVRLELHLGLADGARETRTVDLDRRRQVHELTLPAPARWLHAELRGPGDLVVRQDEAAWLAMAREAPEAGWRAEALRELARRAREGTLGAEARELLAGEARGAGEPGEAPARLELEASLDPDRRAACEQELLGWIARGEGALDAAAALRRLPAADPELRARESARILADPTRPDDLRLAAAVLLLGVRPEEAVAAVAARLGDAGPGLTRDLAALLAQLPSATGRAALERALASADPVRRAALLEGLLEGGARPELRPLLAASLRGAPTDALRRGIQEALAGP